MMTEQKKSGLSIPSSPLPFLAPNRVVVTKAERECSDTVTLTLKCPQDYPAWQPGQFNMLYLFGLGEVPISISGTLKDTNHLTHTIKAVGAVSAALTKLIPGDEVWLRGPFGSTWPEVQDHDDLLLTITHLEQSTHIGRGTFRLLQMSRLNRLFNQKISNFLPRITFCFLAAKIIQFKFQSSVELKVKQKMMEF